jgi:hypothetical protein
MKKIKDSQFYILLVRRMQKKELGTFKERLYLLMKQLIKLYNHLKIDLNYQYI